MGTQGKNVDFSVLEYENYNDYISSFATVKDYRYLSNQNTIKTIVQLGYRTTKIPYNTEEFIKRVDIALEAIRPKTVQVGYFSDALSPTNTDPVLLGFKSREKLNLSKILSVSLSINILYNIAYFWLSLEINLGLIEFNFYFYRQSSSPRTSASTDRRSPATSTWT